MMAYIKNIFISGTIILFLTCTTSPDKKFEKKEILRDDNVIKVVLATPHFSDKEGNANAYLKDLIIAELKKLFSMGGSFAPLGTRSTERSEIHSR